MSGTLRDYIQGNACFPGHIERTHLAWMIKAQEQLPVMQYVIFSFGQDRVCPNSGNHYLDYGITKAANVV